VFPGGYWYCRKLLNVKPKILLAAGLSALAMIVGISKTDDVHPFCCDGPPYCHTRP
jgi:hypothetical protein